MAAARRFRTSASPGIRLCFMDASAFLSKVWILCLPHPEPLFRLGGAVSASIRSIGNGQSPELLAFANILPPYAKCSAIDELISTLPVS
jgi:hypothetical protein